jgi:preprotein translocase subunit SecA
VITSTSAAATALAAGGNGAPVVASPTTPEGAPADAAGNGKAVKRRMRPVEALPTDRAVPTAAPTATPSALGGKGLGGPPPSTPLTYSGPTDDGGTETRRTGGAAAGKAGAATATGNKPSRNAPCPCGSGKKYKLCHGRPGSE